MGQEAEADRNASGSPVVRNLVGGSRLVAASLPPRPPELSERAAGHGLAGTIVAVLEQQPLAADGIWRVMLAGEIFGRLVLPEPNGTWKLLSLDDLTDAQLDAFEKAQGDPASDDPGTFARWGWSTGGG